MSLLADPPLTDSVPGPDFEQPTELADFRVFVLAGIRPAAVSLGVVAVLLLLTIGAGGTGFGDSPAYIAAAWLALHQVPVQIASDFLGLLPLAATAAVVAVSARAARRLASHVRNWRDIALAVAGMVAGPILFAVLAMVLLSNASIESKLEAPPTLSVLGWVAAVHLFGALVGLRKSMPAMPHRLVPGWVSNAGEASRSAVRMLFLAGLFAAVGVMIARWPAVEAFMSAGNGAGGALGLTVVSLLYLPNMAIFAIAVLSGSGVTLGDGSVSLFEVAQGQVPPLPIMAALPDGPAESWWQVFLLVPLLIAVLTGRKCAKLAGARGLAIRTAFVSALITAVVAYASALVSGGALGAIGFVGLSPLLFAVSVFVWFALFGVLGASFRVKVRIKPEPKAKPEKHKKEESAPAEAVADATTDSAAVETTEEVDAAVEPDSDKTDQAKADPVKPDPVKADPVKARSNKAESVKIEPAKADPDNKPGLVSSVVNLLPIPFLKK